jgi:hypothetical protein
MGTNTISNMLKGSIIKKVSLSIQIHKEKQGP